MDIRNYYEEAGRGEVLILLHGNGESSGYFKNQIGFFARYYHVYAIDTRGHGRSERGSAPFTISQFADDLAGFMELHGISKAHILGFSDGGNIALSFALRYPDKVQRLILNGSNLYPGGMKGRYLFPIYAAYAGCRILLGILPASRKLKRRYELLGLMVNEPHIAPCRLRALAMPVLVIAGSHDMIKTAHTGLIAANLKRGRLCILRGDHFISSKRADTFNRIVLAFLAERT